ncbi:MAG: tetratricopeptide repeat protein [Verrucomicrobiaceae bacterium]|nr:MAG: tetratricopeptide repeat protein [Verrucomicrobiaceae bacterium]
MTGTDSTQWEKALALQDHGQALAAVKELRELGRRLVRQRQDLAGILETARQLFGLYDHGTALNLLDASVRLAGKQPALLVRLAMLLVTEGRYAEAARFAREALAQGKSEAAVDVDARLLLAECQERTGHSDEAASLTEEILKAHPASIPAHRLKAVLLRRQGKPQAALEVLRDLLKKGGPPHWETCRAWFELGQVQDQLGDYPGAWQSWITARQFHEAGIDWNVRRSQAEHVWNHVRSLHRSLDGDHLARWCSPSRLRCRLRT